MTKLLAKYLALLRLLLKILLPIALFACLAIPIFGYLVRWGPADEALSLYQNEKAIMVGGSYSSSTTVLDSGRTTSVYRERVYILVPSVLSEPKTVTVSQENDEPYQTVENQNGVVSLLLTYALVLIGVWWFWLRKPVER
jgi:uncharacterized SAM-binding protein YcdF (DUF218 family)